MKEMAEADVLCLQPTEEESGGVTLRRMVMDWWVGDVQGFKSVFFIYGKNKANKLE